jgi:hypothetical protein
MQKALPIEYQAEVIEKGEDVLFQGHDGCFFIYGGKEAFNKENDEQGFNAYALATKVALHCLEERDIVCCGVKHNDNDGQGNFQFIVLGGPKSIIGVNVHLDI